MTTATALAALAASPTTQSLPASAVLDGLVDQKQLSSSVPDRLPRPSPSPAHPGIATPSTTTLSKSEAAAASPTSPVSVVVVVVCQPNTSPVLTVISPIPIPYPIFLLYILYVFLLSFPFPFPKLTFLLISSRPHIHLPKSQAQPTATATTSTTNRRRHSRSLSTLLHPCIPRSQLFLQPHPHPLSLLLPLQPQRPPVITVALPSPHSGAVTKRESQSATPVVSISKRATSPDPPTSLAPGTLAPLQPPRPHLSHSQPSRQPLQGQTCPILLLSSS